MSRPRTGAALLLVLATLVVVVPLAVVLASLASTEKLRAVTFERADVAADIVVGVEPAILDWLVEESSQVVLPPDAAEPVASVMHHMWEVDGATCRVQVAAWDQCGMAPIDVAGSSLPLRIAIPQPVIEVLERVDLPRDQPAGLDLLEAGVRPTDSIDVYPEAPAGEAMAFGSAPEAPAQAPSDPERQTSVGACVATHQPGIINVNTAPISLLERALRSAGRGGIDQVVAARESGEVPTVPPGPPQRGRRERVLQPVAGSTSWAVRIDVTVGTVRRSWWAVYQRPSLSSDKWKCVQRLAITS